VVGGTGFYHQQLLEPNATVYIQPNEKLREKAQAMTIEELQSWLKQINKTRLSSMNLSDKNNPRRLIRAIEITLHRQRNKNQKDEIKRIKSEKYVSVGLFVNQDELESRIVKRVEQRIEAGVTQEIKILLELKLDQNSPAMTATGVEPLKEYLQDKINLEKAKELWSLQELQYAKRQLTWFKKYEPDYWLKVESSKSYRDALGELQKSLLND
jgi:tRNA dimethylallyltransferase